MDRHRQDDGFTLGELCIAVWILGILTLCTLPFVQPKIPEYCTFPDAYLSVQSQAILESSPGKTKENIEFNEHGNVNLARTLRFGSREIIIELGTGRLVFR